MDGEDTTRRRVLVAGGLSSAFGLSGCLRLSQAEPTGTGTTGDDATATTVGDSTTEGAATEEPTETETEATDGDEEAATYPPGVSEDGVTESLVLAHRQQTTDTSRTVETEYMGWQRQTAQFDGDGTILVDIDDGMETYVVDGAQYQRLDVEGTTVYNHADTVDRRFEQRVLAGVELLSGLVRGGNFTPVGTQNRDGDTQFILEADAVANQSALERNRTISRYFRQSEFPLERLSGTALARESGLVPDIEVRLQGNGDGGPFAVRTTDVGSTSVSEPAWTATAESKASEFSLSRTDDGNYAVLEQTAGQTVDGSAVPLQVDAYDGRTSYIGRYEETLGPDTTLYLYKTDETTDFGYELGISTGSPPSTTPADAWSSRTAIHVGVRGMSLFESMSF